MHIQHFVHSKWVCCIEKLLNECGLSEYWFTQNVPKNVIVSKIVNQTLCDQFKQSWSESVDQTLFGVVYASILIKLN